jgi:hypothetical protein
MSAPTPGAAQRNITHSAAFQSIIDAFHRVTAPSPRPTPPSESRTKALPRKGLTIDHNFFAF